MYRQPPPNIIATPLPQPGQGMQGRRWTPGYLDPYMNGAFAAPYATWGPFSKTVVMGFWCFIIVLVIYMILFGGPSSGSGRLGGTSKYYYF